MSENTPYVYDIVRHATLGVGLLTILVNQVVLMDAVAPDAIERNWGLLQGAVLALMTYTVLPYLRLAGAQVLGSVKRRFAEGDSA